VFGGDDETHQSDQMKRKKKSGRNKGEKSESKRDGLALRPESAFDVAARISLKRIFHLFGRRLLALHHLTTSCKAYTKSIALFSFPTSRYY